MTENQFLEKYHDYIVQDKSTADEECSKVNKEGIEVVVKYFPGVGYCLMLKTAAEFLK